MHGIADNWGVAQVASPEPLNSGSRNYSNSKGGSRETTALAVRKNMDELELSVLDCDFLKSCGIQV
jgi:hypothetical protein